MDPLSPGVGISDGSKTRNSTMKVIGNGVTSILPTDKSGHRNGSKFFRAMV